MKIAVASDHAGYREKEELISYLEEQGHEVADFGCESDQSCDYPDYAHPASRAVAEQDCDRGVLVCGSSAGMVMTANRHKQVRAFSCEDDYMAEMSRRHNDANVICFAARKNSVEEMKDWLHVWLDTPFDGGRHERRIRKIDSGLQDSQE